MKTLCKRLYAGKTLVFLLITGLIICSFSACKGKKGDELSSQVSSDKDSTSSTVSIYYKDDEPSDKGYDDIIQGGDNTETDASLSDNLAADAKPQLIVPSDKKENGSESSKSSGTSSANVSHNSDTNSSNSVSSKNSSSKASSTTSKVELGGTETSSKDKESVSGDVQSNDADSKPDNSQPSSSGAEEDTSSKDDTSSSTTSSYDKGYTKPY